MFHLHIIEYLIDTLPDLLRSEVLGETQFGSIVERTLDGEIAMDNIVLWYIAKLSTKGCKMLILVLTVVEHCTRLSWSHAAESIH